MKYCERNNNGKDPEKKITWIGEAVDGSLTTLNSDENNSPLLSSMVILSSPNGTESGQMIKEDEDTNYLETAKHRKGSFSNKSFITPAIYPETKKDVFKKRTSLTDDCANGDGESAKPTRRFQLSNNNNILCCAGFCQQLQQSSI